MGFLFYAVLNAHAAESLKLPVSAHNYVVRFTASAARLESSYGDYTAEDGHRLLVLTATWENSIDPVLAGQRNLPLRAANDDFRESVLLIVDGREAVPALVLEASTANLDTQDPDLVGHSGGSTDSFYIRKVMGLKNTEGKRAQSYFALDKPGDKTTGELLFAIPKRDWQSLELLYRDPLGGTLRVTLAGNPAATREPANSQKNEIFALAATVMEDPAKVEATPPPARRYVAVDFQGRSLLKVKDILPPYDPTHEAGAEDWRPDPAGWVEFHNGLQLVADGALPCAMDSASDAPAEGSFSPELWTHHRLIYLVPASARSLDLVCYFPTYTVPGLEATVTPTPMHFHLAGPVVPAPTAPTKPEAKIIDGSLELTVVRHTAVTTFAGVTAGADELFLAVDFVLRNTGAESEAFKAPEQLVWFAKGGPQPPEESSALGPLTAPDYFGLAAGEARAFRAMWRIPAKLKSAEFGLKGNFVAEKFTLKLPSP